MAESETPFALASMPPIRVRLWLLFWEFAKITTVVIGGGYVILTAAEAEFVRKRRWISPEDFLDLVALAQTVPGIIACNGAIYLGSKVAGFRGALAALAGTALPPMAVITLVAMGMDSIPRGNPHIDGAFLAVNSCVVGLIFATAWRLGKKALKSGFEIAMALAVFLGMELAGINPGLLMAGTIPAGIAYVAWKRRAAGNCKKDAVAP